MKIIRKFKRQISLVLLYCLFLTSFGNGFSHPEAPETGKSQNHIKIALLLDTSGSMDGLLEQAKSQLWQIVNMLAQARKGNANAKVDISLYQYGNSGLSYTSGYISQIVPLTDDLDELSGQLFKLTTNGGDEYCGHVIQRATTELNWNPKGEGLNLIYVVGNEPFNQGKVNYVQACKAAAEKGIIVNTVFCGEERYGVQGFWKEGALQTGGNFASLDMNQVTTYTNSPYDAQIVSLNKALNDTYIPFGTSGKMKKQNQATQDFNSKSYGMANSVDRTISKSSRMYNNSNWDLVDASQKKGVDLSEIKTQDLPEEMQDMDQRARKAYVQQKSDDRQRIIAQIAELDAKRNQYIKQQSSSDYKGLNSVIMEALKSQARTKGFSFEGDVPTVFARSAAFPFYRAAYVDYDFFEETSAKAKIHRQDRLVDFAKFMGFSYEENTIILDTRSKAMYDRMHIKGAVHLNFSDFNITSLAEAIPSKDTRILIYCNNNFTQEPMFIETFVTKAAPPPSVYTGSLSNLENGPKTLALNIPTFINLFGYGYQNVYELSELVSTEHLMLELEGTDVPGNFNSRNN